MQIVCFLCIIAFVSIANVAFFHITYAHDFNLNALNIISTYVKLDPRNGTGHFDVLWKKCRRLAIFKFKQLEFLNQLE
jgi:hypothetical protein